MFKQVATLAKAASVKITSAHPAIGRASLKVQKHSPQILFGAGVVAMGAALYFTGKGTLKVPEILERAHKDLDVIERSGDSIAEKLGDETPWRATMYVYGRTAGDMIKAYWPAALSAAISLACFGMGQRVLYKRVASVTAAFAMADETFRRYRQRIVETYGSDIDRLISADATETGTVKRKDEATGETWTAKTAEVGSGHMPSIYARLFDESSYAYKNDHQLNLYALRCEQNYANDLLRARGHLFLNEVYDRLGFPRTKAGAVVGWLLDADGENTVDFGLYDERNIEFFAGNSKTPLLDFNVDGVIYDKI